MNQNDNLYKRSNLHYLSELEKLIPDTFKAFDEFNQQTLAPGYISVKLKELIAIAVAHVTGCSYCIDIHVKNVKKHGATRDEMADAIMVATALKAGSAMAHGVNALNAYDDSQEDELYKKSYFNRLKEFSELHSEAFRAFMDFDQKALKLNKLSSKEKELIAVAVAHTTGCPYCIDLHTKAAKKNGVSLEELAEAIFVAVALNAGSPLAHGVNALIAYGIEE